MPKEKSTQGKVMDLLKVLGVGDSFYTEMLPNQATSYAYKSGVKFSTKTVIVVEDITTDTPTTRRLTKITLI